jgi:hypothetical protein
LAFLCCSARPSLYSQAPEQVAVDYFFSTLFGKFYKDNVLEFNNKTESALSQFAFWGECVLSLDSVRKELSFEAHNEPGVSTKIRIPDSIVVYRNRGNFNRRLKMRIYCSGTIASRSYVRIDISRLHDFTDSYMIILDAERRVVDFCKSSVIH